MLTRSTGLNGFWSLRDVTLTGQPTPAIVLVVAFPALFARLAQVAPQLAASGLIPAQVMAMIRVAEESNSLDDVLVKISDRMDQKTERKLDMLVRLIEPLMLLTIGGVVMFIIVGVLLPIIDLNSAID